MRDTEINDTYAYPQRVHTHERSKNWQSTKSMQESMSGAQVELGGSREKAVQVKLSQER